MIDASLLLLGIGLGIGHSTEADHVAAVSTLLRREESPLRAARVAVLWGLGHATSFIGVGLLVVLLGLRVPVRFERLADMLIAALLVGLGAAHLLRGERHSQKQESAGRPLAVGLLHGLAGSAGVALVAAATTHSRLQASLYLGLFGLGTVIGMSALTLVISWPIAWANRREGPVARWLLRVPGIFSLALGIFVAATAHCSGI